jgi:hypothetical protein
MSAVHRELIQAMPVIWNSDQSSHFTSPQCISVLQKILNARLVI